MDVACGPNVKTGASVPGYSGGLAAAPNVFLEEADDRLRINVSSATFKRQPWWLAVAFAHDEVE